MRNKKKVEEALLAIAFHMKKCAACVESLLSAGDSKADPTCTEYQRLKAVAKALAGR
jgi:Ni,Fe-hydrogenase I small subunit